MGQGLCQCTDITKGLIIILCLFYEIVVANMNKQTNIYNKFILSVLKNSKIKSQIFSDFANQTKHLPLFKHNAIESLGYIFL